MGWVKKALTFQGLGCCCAAWQWPMVATCIIEITFIITTFLSWPSLSQKRFPIWMLTCRYQAVRGFPSCWLASMSGFSAAALHCCCCCCQGSRDSSAARDSCQAAGGSCLRRCGCLGSLCIPTDYWLTSGLNCCCCCCCCCSWRTGAAGTVAGSLSELGGSERYCCCCGTQTCLDCRCQYWTKEKG